ncbi:MAG: hypothetical protein WC069_03880 [Candidatus Shapirobacteria bacterium]
MPEINETLKTTAETVSETNSVKAREVLIDRQPEAFAPRNVESFLQKIEKYPVALPTFDPNGQPQLTPSIPSSPKIILPVTRQTFVDGFKKSFDDVGNWLSRFIFREIKLKDGNVSFKPDDS